MIRPLEDRLHDTLAKLADHGPIDSNPRSVAEYDEGVVDAAAITCLAGLAAMLANEILTERTRDRSDFIEKLAERATKECELYNIHNRDLL